MTRKPHTRPHHTAALLGAVATATGVAIGQQTPSASADPLSFDAITAGPLFSLIDIMGYDGFGLYNIPIIGSFGLNVHNVEPTSPAINNAINAIEFSLLDLGARDALVLADGYGALAATLAYQALISSAQGNPIPGHSPLEPGTTLLPNVTNQVLGLLWNPARPNGGLFARFAPLFNVFGINPVLPGAGVTSAPQPGIKLNTATLDLTTAYSVLADFPVLPNLFSFANSVVAELLPTYLLGGGTFYGLDQAGGTVNITSLLTLGRLALAGESFYGTFLADDLPILEPLRLPIRIINMVSAALGQPLNLPTPLADAIEPALRILVNIGYDDVVTPSEGGTYNRRFDTAGTHTPFMSSEPLTLQEMLQVPGDVMRALAEGFAAQFQKMFGGPASPSAASSTSTGEEPLHEPTDFLSPVKRSAARPPAATVDSESPNHTRDAKARGTGGSKRSLNTSSASGAA